MRTLTGLKLTIRSKMLLSFTVVILTGLLTLLFVSVRITEQNVSRLIEQDMIQAKKTIDLYIRQYDLTRNLTLDQSSFRAEADGLVKELSNAVGRPVSLYDAKGAGLSDLNEDQSPTSNDFIHALQGNIAYSVTHSGSASTVSLSSPVEADGSLIGVVHFVKDYTELHDFSSRFLTAVKWFAAAISVLVFLTAAVLASRITRPLGRLSRSLKRVSEGVYEPVPLSGVRDEIGDLSLAFNLMVKQIQQQITMIERERDALKRTQAMSKTFFDNVTHELKTPLTTILGYAQMMKNNGFTDKPFFDKGMDYIIEESNRLNDKVVQILEFSTAGANQIAYRLEQVQLTRLVRDVCEHMRVKARKYRMVIHCEAEEEMLVQGDQEKLREMLLNGIDNAVKYGGAGTTVTVVVERLGGWKVRISVIDQGPGIGVEHLQHLFEPFYRTGDMSLKEERGSAGLGLAIVKTIAERHGGSVSVESEPDAGTCLRIELGGEMHA